MKKREILAKKSLKAYFESFIDTEFKDNILDPLIKGNNKSDIDYLIECNFSDKTDCDYYSMDTYYRENFVANLMTKVLGNYDIESDILIPFLSQFKSTDEIKIFNPPRYNSALRHEFETNISRTFLIDDGDSTRKFKIYGENDYIQKLTLQIKEDFKERIIVVY